MKRQAKQAFGGNYVDPDELFTEDDEPHEPAKKSKGMKNKSGGGHHGAHHGGRSEKVDKLNQDHNGRTRPTNNQLLYKAYFRWPHYPCYFKPGTAMPIETDACASVTSAFLQVLHTLHAAEQLRSAGTQHQRSVLQILSTNTRRTKVVELSSGTHRVPEELKKHYLSDGEGGQYSTNLDRNRYGNDDNYLFTVIRYDLEFLGLCPCMVDVEIIDAKAGNQSVIVSAGPDACTCQHKPDLLAYNEHVPVGHHMAQHPMHAEQQQQQQQQPQLQQQQHQQQQQQAPPPSQYLPLQVSQQMPQAPPPSKQQPLAAEPAGPSQPSQPVAVRPQRGTPGPSARRDSSRDSPKPSGSGVSQLFDALVMAATGGQDGGAVPAEGIGGEPPVTSAYLNALPSGAGGGEQESGGAGRAQGRGPQLHQAPIRNKSRLWSAMSFGDMDSLQNALDAFRAEEEIASQPYNQASAEQAGNGNAEGGLLRQRRRKPPRGNSSFLLRAGDSSLGDISLSKLGMKFESEKSGDNQGYDDGTDATAALPADTQDDEHAEGGGGTTGDGTDEVAEDRELSERARMRHVPRQASAVNLSSRVSNAEVSRLRNELEQLRAENKKLREAQASKGDADAPAAGSLESELQAAQAEAASQQAARKSAEERLALTNIELSKARHEIQALMGKLMAGAPGLLGAHSHIAAGALLPAPALDPTLAALVNLSHTAAPVAGAAAASIAAAAAMQKQVQAAALQHQHSSALAALFAVQQNPALLGGGDLARTSLDLFMRTSADDTSAGPAGAGPSGAHRRS